MRKLIAILLLAVCPSFVASAAKKPKRAKNVILLLADAGGIPTLSAASLYAHNAPQKLFVQSWQDMGLSDTTPAGRWVTDSAAGMTAIVTGQKVANGVISMDITSREGKAGGPLKTILEYAEEHGLSTGVVSNVAIADATPVACYAHVDRRQKFGEIFLQIFNPRFGDGVDIVFGVGRERIFGDVKKMGKDLDEVANAHRRPIYSSLEDVPANAQRAIAVLDKDIDLPAATKKAITALSKNRKGYFLMIESDAHTDNPERGLSRLANFDKLIREIASTVNPEETLLLFTADHSFEFRLHGGSPDKPLLDGLEEWKKENSGKKNAMIDIPAMRVGHSHTGEEVLAAAMGPGAERVHGFFPNTYLFEVMMSAYGWKAEKTEKSSAQSSGN